MSQLSKTKTELTYANKSLVKLRDRAEEVAPSKEWQERLACGDMPTELVVATKELNELSKKKFTVDFQLDEMKAGMKKLFDNASAEVKKKKSKKRKVEELEANREGDDEDGVSKSKKKVQASLSTFFGGKSKKAAT